MFTKDHTVSNHYTILLSMNSRKRSPYCFGLTAEISDLRYLKLLKNVSKCFFKLYNCKISMMPVGQGRGGSGNEKGKQRVQKYAIPK